MRSLFLTITFFFYSFSFLNAQSSNGNLIKQTCQLMDGRIQLIEKSETGDTVIIGYLSSVNPEIKNGEFCFYDSTKILQAKGNYIEDIPSGIWRYYDKKGNIAKTINYNRTIEFLKADSVVPKEVFLVVKQMPYFKSKNPDSFKDYVKENMVYPIYAEKKNISARVFIQFIITKSGKIRDLKVIRSSGNMDLNMEALRIMSESPLWVPGVQGRDTVDVSYTYPITFRKN